MYTWFKDMMIPQGMYKQPNTVGYAKRTMLQRTTVTTNSCYQ
jgi:hypothetical protein